MFLKAIVLEISLIFCLTVIPAIILFGIAKSGLGGSVSLVSIPLMTIVMPLNHALAILLPILILSDFIAAYRFRKDFDRETLNQIIPFAAIGVIVLDIILALYILPVSSSLLNQNPIKILFDFLSKDLIIIKNIIIHKFRFKKWQLIVIVISLRNLIVN